MEPKSDVSDRAAVRTIPPALPLLTIIAGIVLQNIWPIHVAVGIDPTLRYMIGACISLLSLLLLGLWSVALMRTSGQSVLPRTPTTSILESGPYRFSRNPMYLGMIVLCVGFSIMLSNVWILLLTPVCGWLLYALAIRPEEAYLERKFGDAYVGYKIRVRRWI
jgi:protein-S-isoprenylcysteine O-methyltransferase Ste14